MSTSFFGYITLISMVSIGIYGCAPTPNIRPLNPSIMQGSGTNPRVVRIGYMNSLGHAPAILGFADGTFNHAFGENVSVIAVQYDNQITAMKSMFDREIDIMFMDPAAAYSGYVRSFGNSFKLVSGVSTSLVGMLVHKSTGSFDLHFLKDARIAVPSHGGIEEIMLRKLLASARLKTTDRGGSVTITPVRPSEVQTLFDRGEIDAAFLPEPWLSKVASSGNARIVQKSVAIKPGCVLGINYLFLQFHPMTAQNFLIAFTKEMTTVKSARDVDIKRLTASLNEGASAKLSAEEVKRTLSTMHFGFEGYVEELKAIGLDTVKLGFAVENSTNVNHIYTPQALNNALKKQGLSPLP